MNQRTGQVPVTIGDARVCYNRLTALVETQLRSMPVIIQERDGSIVEEPEKQPPSETDQRHYYAEVPNHLLDEQSSLIDRIIGVAFDVFGARRLELRVYEPEDCC